ncbi:MAG: class I SAM-dependent methyltransferase [Peptococcaceae bacterium]|nr:class I SAM-dependent methyltransferase [Peptococcaceae bacterium]
MYQDLAVVYDQLATIDYGQWAGFIDHIFQAVGGKVHKVLDLACGTGNITCELARLGYQMTGVDLSEAMLSVAESKLRPWGVPLLQGDMRELPLLGEFDAVVCTSDSLNYLLNASELAQVFSAVHRLEPDIFVFDLNTPHYLAEILGNNSFQHLEDDLAYIWDNSFAKGTAICTMELTFFLQQGGSSYRRFDETHREKAYALSTVRELLQQSGWYLWEVLDGYAARSAIPESERWVCVAGRKPVLDSFRQYLVK